MVLLMLTAEPQPRHRHTALAIRAYIGREKITMSEFSRRVDATHPSVAHSWTKGTGAVGEQYRPAVARLLGVSVAFLEPWNGEGSPPDMGVLGNGSESPLGPARAARALVPASTVQAPPVPALGGKLAYEGHGDGTATISVRARLPLSQAKPLFRLLLDSGIDLEDGEP